MTPIDLYALLPLIVLVSWASLLLLVDLFIPPGSKGWTAALAALGLLVTMALVLTQAGESLVALNGMLIVDGFSIFLSVLLLGSGVVGISLAYDYLKRMEIERGEYYSLLLFSIVGMMLMSMAANLIVVFLALELLSIPLYVLAGFALPREESEEASLKYFLLGAFSAGFMVYGIALVYGATATTSIVDIVTAINSGTADIALLSIGAALVLIGLGFKVAAVPFHMWTPDVYQGAPSAVTAFMSVGAKVGGFAALLRVFFLAFPAVSADLTPVLWVVAALTMILGNFVAIAQTDIKRLLAYSSIAHAGYILMALVPFGQDAVAPDAVASALFYLMAYAITNFAAWAVVIAVEHAEGAVGGPRSGLTLPEYAGLGRKYPMLAAVMAAAMFSFTGVPPTIGFVGKFYIFRTVLQAGYIWLALIGVFTSLISAYYYLRVVIIMYMEEGEPLAVRETLLTWTAALAGLAIVVFGIFSSPLFAWAARAVLHMV